MLLAGVRLRVVMAPVPTRLPRVRDSRLMRTMRYSSAFVKESATRLALVDRADVYLFSV